MTDPFVQIARLKEERNAVILAHYYQDPDIQDVADFLGDSLALAKEAMRSKADMIVLCGVKFMAETAKLLNPDKLVVMPDLEAGCSLAESGDAEQMAFWKSRYPNSPLVSYINTTVEVKAISDVIVTSSNAKDIIEQIDADKILFAPDRNMGAWLRKETGRNMELWPGTCMVHETFQDRELIRLQTRLPGAPFIAHPECEAHILARADFIGSTSKLLRYVEDTEATDIIVGTEMGILHEMRKRIADSGKTVHVAPAAKGSCDACAQCPHMKLNTLEKIAAAMQRRGPAIEIDPELRDPAYRALAMMFEMEAA